jgi:hypothetical protein
MYSYRELYTMEKCSLNSINKLVVMISTVVLTITLIATIVYFIYVKYNTAYEMFQEEQTVSVPISAYQQETNTMGESSCTFPKIKYPPEAEFRTCQVYLTNDKDACDAAKAADPHNTCKYEFKGWKEFNTTKDENNNQKKYEFKEYTRDSTKPIINDFLVTKCFKEFQHNSFPMPFEYQNNSLVNHDCSGMSRDTDHDTNRFNGIKYTSFNFLNSTNANANYNNLLNSICSVKYDIIPSLKNKTFIKLVLDSNRNINDIKKLTINGEQTGFVEDKTFDVSQFTSSSAYGMAYDTSIPGKNFRIFSVTSFSPKPVRIYKFIYNYLCEDKQIMSIETLNARLNLSQLVEVQAQKSVYTNINMRNIPLNGSDYMTKGTEDQKPKLMSDLETLLTNKRNTIETNYSGLIQTEQNVIDTNTGKGRDEYAQYNPSFEQITNIANFNIKKGAIVHKKEIDFQNIDIYTETVVKEVAGESIEIVSNKIANSTDYYYQFTEPNVNYKLTLSNNTTCDILVVGGGGAGGHSVGGGGGAGGVVYQKGVTLNAGTYTINVGMGGTAPPLPALNANSPASFYVAGNNGSPSSISFGGSILQINGISYEGKGGGGGACALTTQAIETGLNGGCGGGGSVNGGAASRPGGTSTQGNTYLNSKGGFSGYAGASGAFTGGGGGGLGVPNPTHQANGAVGVQIDITGTQQWYAAGGAGGTISSTTSYIGGSGIGGDGTRNANSQNTVVRPSRNFGVANTGSGGGGGGYDYYGWARGQNGTGGGAGGSGIVIIRFKKTTNIIMNTFLNNLSFFTNTANLKCWYKMDSSDNMLLDSSGNNNNLSNNNTIYDDNSFSKGKGSIKFDVRNYLNISPNINPYQIYQAGGITVSLWFKASVSSGTWCRIFDFGDNNEGTSPSNHFLIAKYGDSNRLLFFIDWSTYYLAPENYFNDKWYHIVWSISKSGICKIYINNILKYSNNSWRIPNANWQRRYIGKSCYSQDGSFIGNIDDFRIYDKVLSYSEIFALYLHDDITQLNQDIYKLSISTTEYAVTPQYMQSPYVFSTVLNANSVFIYNVFAYLYLQKGTYKFYAYLSQIENNQIPCTCELYILDQNDIPRLVSYFIPNITKPNTYDVYTVMKNINIPSGGFYKTVFKSNGNNNKNTMTTELKINVEYTAIDNNAINLNTLMESFSTDTAFKKIYNVSQKPFTIVYSNWYNNNNEKNSVNRQDIDNYAKYMYYGFDITSSMKDAFKYVYNTLPGLTDLAKVKLYLHDNLDYFGIKKADAAVATASQKKRRLEIERDVKSGVHLQNTYTFDDGSSVSIETEIANIRAFLADINNIDYKSLLGISQSPRLKTDVNVFSIFDGNNGINEDALTIERFSRDKLRIDGSLPATAERSLYIETFV